MRERRRSTGLPDLWTAALRKPYVCAADNHPNGVSGRGKIEKTVRRDPVPQKPGLVKVDDVNMEVAGFHRAHPSRMGRLIQLAGSRRSSELLRRARRYLCSSER